MHIYVDETTFDASDGQRTHGVAALVVPSPVDPELIARSLECLRIDPDRKDPHKYDPRTEKSDIRTLAHGYFHASDDSQNAHSPLAKEISSHVRGRLLVSFCPTGKRTEEAAFRMSAIDSLVPTLKLNTTAEIVFEQRSGFSTISAEALIQYIYAGMDHGTYDFPLLPNHYPSMKVVVAGKSHPGLQVVDLLLWSVVQEKFHPTRPKARVASWCGLQQRYDAHPVDGSARWIVYDLNQEYPRIGIGVYPLVFTDIEAVADRDELANLYCYAERLVRTYERASLPPQAEHLRAPISRDLSLMENSKHVTPDMIKNIARHFVRLFDTVPIYGEMNPDRPSWIRLLKAKRFMGLALRSDIINGVATMDFFTEVRRQNVAANPSAFGLEEPSRLPDGG